MEIENAKITNVSLTMRDYCSLVFEITVEGAGWACNIGGYKIGSGMLGAKPEDFSAETGAGLVAIMRIMDVVGVDRWEDLEGKYCRVKTEGWGGTIHCIGNILKNKWFDIKEFFQNYKETSGRLKSEWTVEEENGYSVICDNCSGEMNFATQYCPDCGAFMGEPCERKEEKKKVNVLGSNWEALEDEGLYECQHCAKLVDIPSQYCPDCGAFMQNFNYEEG